jgi:hypothetical protein
MKVHVTFDVEVWCNSWNDLDVRFPTAFDRYCYGRSKAGEYALPKTLEVMRTYGLVGVFFVEPLFAARFGERWLATIVDLIAAAGQDVQLHLHPEWTDEINPPPIADVSRKRQHLVHYTEAEQSSLIAIGRCLLERAKGAPVHAFRAGSFAANADTYRALRSNGLLVDSSLNASYDYSAGSIDGMDRFTSRRTIEGVEVYPVTAMRDGFGRLRAAQINGCSFGEMRAALVDAERAGVEHFVIVSHNFDLMKPSSCAPDRIVVQRFETLARFLAQQPERFQVEPFPKEPSGRVARSERRPAVAPWQTVRRYLEQAVRTVV